MEALTRIKTGTEVQTTINSARWKATIVGGGPLQPLVRLVELLEGNSILRPGHQLQVDLRYPASRWAQSRGYGVLAIGDQWF